MTAPPSFSIVVPVHDGATWLDDAIESIRRQSRDDWELIVVDDGSQDESSAAAHEHVDPRVRLLRQANAGVLAARRAGLAVARGRYVVFLDADDRLCADALSRFAAILERRADTAVAYGDRVLADPSGRVYGARRGALLNPRPSGDVLERLLTRNFLSTPGQACIRVRVLEDSRPWRTDLRRMADWYLWCRIASRNRFAYIGRGPVIEYRLHGGSMSRRFTAQGSAAPSIADLEPSIEAVFALPEVARRFTPTKLAVLRRRSEASAYAWKAQELLRAGRFRESRRYLVEALRRHPTQPVDLLSLLLACVGFIPPGLTRWVGRF